MRMKFTGAAAAIALAVAAGGVSAETITLKQQAGSIFAGGGNATVQTNLTGNTSVGAGGFRVEEVGGAGRKFLAWCMSLLDDLNLPGIYTATAAPFENRGELTSTQIGMVQGLFDTAYTGLNVSGSAQGNIDSAAFQLALWNIIYDLDTNRSVSTGNFTVTASQAIRDRADLFLGGIDSAGPQEYILTFWEAKVDSNGKPLSQNLVTAAPIPLPAAVWMLLAAIGATVAATRRRRAEA